MSIYTDNLRNKKAFESSDLKDNSENMQLSSDEDFDKWEDMNQQFQAIRENLALKNLDFMQQSTDNTIFNAQTSLNLERTAMERKQTDAMTSISSSAAQACMKRADQWNNS
jgi:hypothetical protein